MSPLTEALVVNGIVLFSVLEADLGSHRKIGRVRILRPLLTAAAVVPLFLDTPATHGHGLALEIAGIAIGCLLGILANRLMTVYRSPHTGRPVSAAGAGYAALWVAVVGARSAFSFGSGHWFSQSLASWMVRNQISVDALTDTLIMMAIAMVLTRTIAVAARAASLEPTSASPASASPVSAA